MEREEIAGLEVATEPGARQVTCEAHVLVDAQLRGQRAQRRRFGPGAADHQGDGNAAVEAAPQRAQQRVDALLRGQALQREHQTVPRRHLERGPDRGAVAGRRRDLDTVGDHLAPPAAAAVDRVAAVAGDVGGVGDQRDERALPPAPERGHTGAGHVAAVHREHGRHAEPALGHDAGESGGHRVVHVQHVGTRRGDRAAHGRHRRQREGRQGAGRPAMTAHAHQRHAVLVVLDGERHQRVVLRRALLAVQRRGQHRRQQPDVVAEGQAAVDLQHHQLGAADDGQERGREDEDLHTSTRR